MSVAEDFINSGAGHQIVSEEGAPAVCLRCRCTTARSREWLREPCGQDREAGWYPVQWRVSGVLAVACWDRVEEPKPWRYSLWSVVCKELGYNDEDLRAIGPRIRLEDAR